MGVTSCPAVPGGICSFAPPPEDRYDATGIRDQVEPDAAGRVRDYGRGLRDPAVAGAEAAGRARLSRLAQRGAGARSPPPGRPSRRERPRGSGPRAAGSVGARAAAAGRPARRAPSGAATLAQRGAWGHTLGGHMLAAMRPLLDPSARRGLLPASAGHRPVAAAPGADGAAGAGPGLPVLGRSPSPGRARCSMPGCQPGQLDVGP